MMMIVESDDRYNFGVASEDPTTHDAILLMDELSDILEAITGRSGRNSFDTKDMSAPRSVFVIARDNRGNALGCGALRPLTDDVAEVKRMYARAKSRGVGTAILTHLEQCASNFGYTKVWLETGIVNEAAVSFYRKRGYRIIPNYGKYAGNAASICFEKAVKDVGR